MKRPPQLKGAPISGHYRRFKRDPVGLLMEASQEFGEIFMLRSFSKHIYFINDPSLVEHVCQSNHQNYIKTPKTPVRNILGESIVTADGEEWVKRRRMYQPALNRSSIENYFSTIVGCTREMDAHIVQQLDKGHEVNVTRLMTNVTASILGATLFGVNLKIDSQLYEDFSIIVDWLGDRRFRYPFVMPLSIKTPKNKIFIEAVKRMNTYVEGVIQEKKAENEKGADLLNTFIEGNGRTGESLTDQEIRHEATAAFLAGHETSSNVLNWTFYLLATHPEVQEKVAAEALSVGKNQMSTADMHSMTFTMQVLNEAMRMYPPVWHFGRVAVDTDELMGYKIEPGTPVRICPLTLHYREDYWSSPSQFDPNRFDPIKEIPLYTHIPFGAGPRLCAGRNLAIMEMLVILVVTLSKYKVSYSGPQVAMHPTITLRSKGDINLTFHKR